jgi:phosphopantetheinyl transferase (holo-ACP synthase)
MLTVHIAQCRISELAAAREATAAACLGVGERARLAGAPVRRLAGVIAAKRAVLQLVRQPDEPGSGGFGERDVQVGHDPDGAPRLDAVPLPLQAALARQGVRISISHTGDHAFGLAVLEVDA